MKRNTLVLRFFSIELRMTGVEKLEKKYQGIALM